MDNSLRAVFDRVRKLFATGKITRPDYKAPQVQTLDGTIVKKEVLWPYGFSSFPEDAVAVVMFKGGDQGAGKVLYLSNRDGEPDLGKWDSAVWARSGAAVIARDSGKLNIHSDVITLKAWLDELIDICAGITTTGTSTNQSLSLDVVTKLNLLKQKTAQLLED